jgi:hypothetical protein
MLTKERESISERKKNYPDNINEDITGSLAHKLSIGGLVTACTALVGCRIRRACWMTVVQRH